MARISLNLVGSTLFVMPLPLDLGAAYGNDSLIIVVAMLAYFFWAMRVSVGSRRLLDLSLDE